MSTLETLGVKYIVIEYLFVFEQTGWKENHPTFVLELKNLRATGLSTFGRSLKEAIDLLSVHRLHTGIDHYGQVNNSVFFGYLPSAFT